MAKPIMTKGKDKSSMKSLVPLKLWVLSPLDLCKSHYLLSLIVNRIRNLMLLGKMVNFPKSQLAKNINRSLLVILCLG